MITHFEAVFSVESNALNTLLVFEKKILELSDENLISQFCKPFCLMLFFEKLQFILQYSRLYLDLGSPHFCGQQRYLTDAILDAITCQKGNTPRCMLGWKNYRLPCPKTFTCMIIKMIRKEVPK